MSFNSNTIALFEEDSLFQQMNPDKKKFVDDVYAVCERNYDAGGDIVVECFDPARIVEEFNTLADVEKYIEVRLSRALDCREGNDNDPELLTWARFEESNWEAT